MRRIIKQLIVLAMMSLMCKSLKFEDIGNYEFEPNKPVDISNPLLWSIKASCKISTTDESDNLKGVMKKGKGTLNGQSVGTGVELDLKNGDILTITATSLASVEITNLGTNTVSASCSLGEETIKEIRYMRSILDEEDKFLNILQ
jgi:hypothetical protein